MSASVTARQIVVAFRMDPAGIAAAEGATYLARVRSLRSRGEALGGRLVAWSGALLAMAWESDAIEEAVLLATSALDGTRAPERQWSSGVAEGELEPLAPDGQVSHLAWGHALQSAISLARVAIAGEVLVDSDVRALREGQLSILGARASTDGGRRVRGWRLDVDHPWKRDPSEGAPGHASSDPEAANDWPGLELSGNEFSTEDVLEIIEASAMSPESEGGAGDAPQRGALAECLRRLARGECGTEGVDTLSQLRLARDRAEGASAAARCQVAIALAMALFLAGRPEDALLEALDALARAHEAEAPRAKAACLALLSKLYAAVGMAEVAIRLHAQVTSATA
ncbi:MAG: hypothetical protein M3O36_01860 [Myxococcota bacterium]|nr:hypothetical protein [Myxococcota bacterium]